MPMLSKPLPVADPDAVSDYTMDFAVDAPPASNLTAASAALTVRTTLPGYVVDSDPASRLTGAAVLSGTIATQRVSGLQAGNDYLLSVRGTLSDGRVVTLWGLLRCREIGAPVLTLPGQQVGFDYLAWLAIFPEFDSIDEAAAYGYFIEATGLHDNTGLGPVTDDAQQSYLLNLLTAHIAARYAAGQPGAGSPIVGPIVGASEGSVSISGQPLVATGTQAWYLTTKYGADYWAATAAYRTMHYRVAAPRIFDPFRANYRRGW